MSTLALVVVIVVAVLLLTVIGLVGVQRAEIRRYLKIRGM